MDVNDFAAFAYNGFQQNLQFDANGDGNVNVFDFALLAYNFGKKGYKEIVPNLY